MHDRLFEARGRLEVPDLLRMASELGLDSERIATELGSGAHAPRVQRDVDSGRAAGITGTPAFFTNGRLHEGAFDAGSLTAALEAGAHRSGASG
jgi:predicted DsbA family dithiol-disulfide isomerase